MTSPWPFVDPEDTVAITLERILRAESPILLVTHDREDGGWQFLDGAHVMEEDGVVVQLGEMIQFDPSLEDLADLPMGWHAWRSALGSPWHRAEGDSPGESRRAPEDLERSIGATNIEIKARVNDPEQLRRTVEAISDTQVEILHQQDVFFKVPSGRLKLRILGEGAGELIHYRRPDSPEPRASRYQIAPTSAPEVLRSILGEVLPVLGTVKKVRGLYLVGRTRIHLDNVENLGHFLELEVVLRPGQTEEAGIAVAQKLLTRLEIDPDQLVRSAYIDLVKEGSSFTALPGDDPA
jgi:predicted adenylyl cyclase CyaB